jgi:dTDP-4-dehydrorhamnose reductase
MKILITGINGLVGNALFNFYSDSNYELLLTSRNLEGLASVSLDITKKKEVDNIIDEFKPDAVINTAAIADVDLCEEEKEVCWNTNVTAIGYLIDACKRHDTHLIHISTDYIFNGEKDGLYVEKDNPDPLSYYGESKLGGENLLKESSIDYAILRTILVYGKHKKLNIVLKVKNGLESGDQVNLVDDQIRTLTYVDDLVRACDAVISKRARGVYHISGNEMMSYHEIGMKIADHFSLDKSLINKMKTSSLNQKAKRPPKTGFVIEKAIRDLDYKPTKFDDALDEMFNC